MPYNTTGSNGLLQGVSEGLRLGLQGFLGERERRDKKALQEQEQESLRQKLAYQIAKDEEDRAYRTKSDELGLLAKGIHRVGADYKPQNGEVVSNIGGENYAKSGTDLGDIIKKLQVENLTGQIADRNEKKTPQGKYEAMPAQIKENVAHVANVLKGLTDYESAFKQGGRKQYVDANSSVHVPLLGKVGVGGLISDTPITLAEKVINEEFGRLQSGGAISVDEEARFRELDPRAADDEETQIQKLIGKRQMMENKLIALGVTPDQLSKVGFDPMKLGYDPKVINQKNRGLLPNIGRQQVAQGPQPEVKSGSIAGATTSVTPPPGMIHVSNGKGEDYWIKPSNLAKAQKKGFRQVK